MNRFRVVFPAFVFLLVSQVFATAKVENDPVFIRIGNKNITLSEFVHAYQKNNNSILAAQISPEEYLELFINFKLKVKEAMALGLDTVPTFIRELAGYREQLAKPYLSDQQVIEDLIMEAYERSRYDIRASHILVRLDAQAAPADTLAAWQRANSIMQRLLNGEPFGKVAAEESDDPSARDREVGGGRPPVRGNGGDLGYFTVFNMVYPFESVAFSLQVGEISKPVRSDFGYHIIKVADRLPAMGRARVAHIMAMFTPEMDDAKESELKKRIELALEKYRQGAEFSALVQDYSEDLSSKGNNGEMRPFGSREMVPEFIKAISSMQPGDVSNPVRTNFGWHLIKLIEKELPPSFDEAYPMLKNSVMQDSRAFLSEQAVVDRLKKEYSFSLNERALQPFYQLVDSTIFAGRWELTTNLDLREMLFSFDGLDFIQQDFADYLLATQANRPPASIQGYIRTMLDEFAKGKLLDHENALLEKKFPEFKAIVSEYHDGMLLFEITNQMVWNRAVQDTLGLKDFFFANRHSYVWPQRVRARVFGFEELSEAKSFSPKKPKSNEQVLATSEPAQKQNYSLEEGVFQKGQNSMVDLVEWEIGISKPLQIGNKFYIVEVQEVLPSGYQELHEIRGHVINDYQTYLDQKWIKELRSRHEVYVYRDLLKKISN